MMGAEIIEILEYVGKQFGIVIDWTSTEVIPYLELLGGKIINYEFWMSIMWIVFGLICLIPVVRTQQIFRWYHAVKQEDRWDWRSPDYESLQIFLVMGILVAGLIGALVVFVQASDIITCLTLPEKRLFSIICLR